MDFDVCKCNMGWTGSNCAQYSCEQLDYCSGELSLEILYIVYELSYIQISEEHKDFISKNTLVFFAQAKSISCEERLI